MNAARRRRLAPRGFSLLEVAIAMSILIVAMTALMGHEGIAIQMSDYSNRLSQATLLLQGKMLDVEYKLLKDGMDQLDDCEEGDFHAEDMRAFTWKACAYKMEMAEGAGEQFVEQIKASLAGFTPPSADGEGATGAGALGADPMDPEGNNPLDSLFGNIEMVAGALPMLVEQFADKLRKVRVEVTWKDAIADRTLVIERFVTSLGEDRTDAAQEVTEEDMLKEALEGKALEGLGQPGQGTSGPGTSGGGKSGGGGG